MTRTVYIFRDPFDCAAHFPFAAPLRVTWRGSEACDILPPVILRSNATKDLMPECKM